MPTLEKQARVMFEAINVASARKAVEAGIIQSEEKFQPSREDSLQMLSKAFAIVANMSPKLSQQILGTHPSALQAAVADHAGQRTDGQPSQSVLPDQGNAPLRVPEPTSDPFTRRRLNTPDNMSIQARPARVAGPENTLSILLDQSVTEVSVQVSAKSPGSGEPPPVLEVIIPSTAYLHSFRQRRLPPSDAEHLAIANQQPVETNTTSFLSPGCLPLTLPVWIDHPSFGAMTTPTPHQTTGTIDPSVLHREAHATMDIGSETSPQPGLGEQ